MDDKPSALLSVKEVSKSFGGLVAVNLLSFDVFPGEIVAVIGPNGAGKTTLFNLITGFLTPDRGYILFDGRDFTGQPPHRIAEAGMARTFQNLQLFTNMSVLENAMMGRYLQSRAGLFSNALRLPHARREEKAIEEAAMAKLDMMGLAGDAHLSPDSLPYGRQKLLEIARALAVEPRLLLVDEPAGGLSTQEIEDLAKVIRRIRSDGITTLLVEHRMELVMGIADRIVVLNFGSKIAEGSPHYVQKNDRVITAYLGEEF